LRSFNDVHDEPAIRIDLMRSFQFLCAATLLLVAARPLAAPAHLTSAAASTITIDGLVDEWPQLEPLEETHLSAAAQNDGRNLYLMIATSDQARRRQLLAAGIIVWLDAEGGKKHTFGIRIPGMLFSGALGGRRGPHNQMPPPDLGEARQAPALSYVEIVGPGKDDRRRLELDATRSIQAARSQTAGTLTLELQIPLQRNDATEHAIGTRAGHVIGLGLETPKIERPEGPAPGAGGAGGHRGGGMGGGFGGHGGGGGGGRGGMGGMGGGGGRGGGPPGSGAQGDRFERAEPLKYWTTVQLASA
jgi:hypothetical protein